mmetsp:Transcript_16643/g.16735  ORF Transcript_16643/g.16735 Transcript_16643/m.16735 type:complete len:466 (+) Transcript_16643:260-1657(+)
MLRQFYEDLSESSFYELGNFARSNPSHAAKLIENGVCEIVLQRLKSDGQKPNAAFQCCFALHSLAVYPTARIRLCKYDSVELIMKLFVLHSRNVKILQNMTWLLRNLCYEAEACDHFILLKGHITILNIAQDCFDMGILSDINEIFAALVTLTSYSSVRRDLLDSKTRVQTCSSSLPVSSSSSGFPLQTLSPSQSPHLSTSRSSSSPRSSTTLNHTHTSQINSPYTSLPLSPPSSPTPPHSLSCTQTVHHIDTVSSDLTTMSHPTQSERTISLLEQCLSSYKQLPVDPLIDILHIIYNICTQNDSDLEKIIHSNFVKLIVEMVSNNTDRALIQASFQTLSVLTSINKTSKQYNSLKADNEYENIRKYSFADKVVIYSISSRQDMREEKEKNEMREREREREIEIDSINLKMDRNHIYESVDSGIHHSILSLSSYLSLSPLSLSTASSSLQHLKDHYANCCLRHLL